MLNHTKKQLKEKQDRMIKKLIFLNIALVITLAIIII